MKRLLLVTAAALVALVLAAIAAAWPFLSAMHVGFLEALGALLR